MKNIAATIMGLIGGAWRAFGDASPMVRGAVVVGAIATFLAIVDRDRPRATDAEVQAAIDASYRKIDSRYTDAANRAGYKGKEAEEIGAAAARLCRGTGGSDC